MKKKILLFCMLSSICLANTEEMTIDKLLSISDALSLEKNLFDINKAMQINTANALKLGDFNGIDIAASYNASSPLDKFDFHSLNFSTQVAFGPFFAKFNRIFNEQKDIDYISYGLKKNLKDVFYSKYNSELSKLELKDKIIDLELKKTLNAKKQALIDIYTDVLNAREDLNIKKEALETLLSHNKILSKSYDLGVIPKIDLDSNEYQLKAIKMEIQKIEQKINSLDDIIYNNYKVHLKDYSLKEISIENKDAYKILSEIGTSDLSRSKLELEIAKEDEKYQHYNAMMPDLVLSFSRTKCLTDDVKANNIPEENLVSLEFHKRLFSNDPSVTNTSYIKESKEMELKILNQNIENDRVKNKLEYDSLKNSLTILEEKLNLEYKKYQIREKEYQLNKITYLELMETYNKYLETKADLAKLKNNINAFVYKKLYN